MAQQSGASSAGSSALRDDGMDDAIKPKHMVFLSHSGAQKIFVEVLCEELERCCRFPFFDKRRESLPIGDNFVPHIFDAIEQCHVGVVILSDEFISSKWPMMELVAMVERARKSNFKIMPIYLETSPKQLADPMKHNDWLSKWLELAIINPKRVEVEKWEAALKYLRPINGLTYEGGSKLEFLKKIVEEICSMVPAEIKLDDSHIVGRSRLCKVILNKINLEQGQVNSSFCVLGLYGMGGIGKTSICKALCNELFTDFSGRVCHAEMERGSEEELLRKVLKDLTNIDHKCLDNFNEDQLRNLLKEGIKEAVFLALDNVSDCDASVKQAKVYLSKKLPPGSIVMVTARSKDLLTRLRPYIDESKCLQMPELVQEEAKSLFAQSSDFRPRNEADEELILQCVKQCYFSKGDDKKSFQYHPLALDVLGRQLGCIDPKGWRTQLNLIDADIFNQSEENNHPIFSILRKSYDSLSLEDQHLFMDVLFFLPDYKGLHYPQYNVFKWLGIVHGNQSEDRVIRRLETLKRKSLLDSLGDGLNTRMVVHDLWRSFCVAEIKRGEFRYQHCVFVTKNSSSLVNTSLSESCWENVKRMAFVGSRHPVIFELENVTFAHLFPSVTVLKITGVSLREMVVLDLSGLSHLKSLEVSGKNLHRLVLKSLPKSLIFLRIRWFDEVEFRKLIAQALWRGSLVGEPSEVRQPSEWFGAYEAHHTGLVDSQGLMKQMGYLTQLQYLQLIGSGGDQLPDMGNMISIRVAIFRGCDNVVTWTPLRSMLSNLRVLDFTGCTKLRSCSGVGDLVNLEELICEDCEKLQSLPNLQKLKKLRKLNISSCHSIIEVPGLGALVALEELHANYGSDLLKLSDMRNLGNLQVLMLRGCYLEAVPGFGNLISLRKVEANFKKVVEWPNLRQLTKLQKISINGWSLEGLKGLHNLVMLHTLCIRYCCGVDELPDCQSLIRLQWLKIEECEFKDVSGLSNLTALKSLEINRCNLLERVPDLQRLTRLETLDIWGCEVLRGWDCTLEQVEVSPYRLDDSSDRSDLLASQRVSNMRTLKLNQCPLADVTIIGAFTLLEMLECSNLRATELPDLSNFPRLKSLTLKSCESLRLLTSRQPIYTLILLGIRGCSGMIALPDLGMFPALWDLYLYECSSLAALSSSVFLRDLSNLAVGRCRNLSRANLDQFEQASCSGHCIIQYYE